MYHLTEILISIFPAITAPAITQPRVDKEKGRKADIIFGRPLWATPNLTSKWPQSFLQQK